MVFAVLVMYAALLYVLISALLTQELSHDCESVCTLIEAVRLEFLYRLYINIFIIIIIIIILLFVEMVQQKIFAQDSG